MSDYMINVIMAVLTLIALSIGLLLSLLWLCKVDSRQLRKTHGRCYYFGHGSSPCGDPECPDCHGAVDNWKPFRRGK